MGDSGSIGIQRHAFHVFIHCCISGRHQFVDTGRPRRAYPCLSCALSGGYPEVFESLEESLRFFKSLYESLGVFKIL